MIRLDRDAGKKGAPDRAAMLPIALIDETLGGSLEVGERVDGGVVRMPSGRLGAAQAGTVQAGAGQERASKPPGRPTTGPITAQARLHSDAIPATRRLDIWQSGARREVDFHRHPPGLLRHRTAACVDFSRALG